MRPSFSTASLIAAAVLALAACGGGDENGEATSGGPSLETIEISETDFALEPSTVTVDEPGLYTFRAVNDGGTEHALEVEGEGLEEMTESLAPGESAELTVELKQGRYELYCPVGNHAELGMEGSISVAGGGSAGGGGSGDDDEDGGDYGY
jgi:uncharacterized cupredoxin-like copper-binding protein